MTDATATNTGRRAGLDRADMVAAALALVEKEGPAALSMRRLASELSVTTNTVYWHVGSRDELITEIIIAKSRQQAERTVQGITARERVASAAAHVWDSAHENRAITSLAHQTGTTSLLEHPLEVALASELEAAGLRGADAAEALRSILATVGGFLVGSLRDESAIPAQRRGTTLWANSTATLDPTTIGALAQPAVLEPLFRATLDAVVAAHVPESGAP